MKERLRKLRKQIDDWFFEAIAREQRTDTKTPDAPEPSLVLRFSGLVVVPSTKGQGDTDQQHNQPGEERP